MSTVLSIRRQRKALRVSEHELIEQEKAAIRRSFIRCQRCIKQSRLSTWVFVQKRAYVSPYSCTEGDYWHDCKTHLCDVVCPNCGESNYINNHPQRAKFESLLGERVWRPQELFADVIKMALR